MKLSGFKVKSQIKFEFHVSRQSRNKYNIETTLFSLTGDLLIANFHQARILADKINKTREKEPGSQPVTAGQINALGLLHEIFHYIIRYYEEKENPMVFSRGLNYLQNSLGKDELDKILLTFIDEFPPVDVYTGKILPIDYLNSLTSNKPNREIILEELLLLNLENENPAISSLEELYSDQPLVINTKYSDFINETEKFFITEKPFGKDNLPLTQFLKKPLKINPYSIEGQLDYILNAWGVYVYSIFYDRLLGGKDLLHEDYKLFVPHGGGEKATPPVPQYKYDADFFALLKAKIAAGEMLSDEEAQFYYSESEQFTEDIDWMPRVVMIAKNTYVWLDQLSKKYQREIKRLDQVPDEELDNLSRWNFTALWLIGIWERSSASKKIKHMTGNPEAVSSAYSLYDYVIAEEIGGEEAFGNLKNRCWQRGIRLSSDMVPNHTGIFSKWVIEKPHYFIQAPYPPYPGYSFNGPNLSEDNRVEVRIEDKYYNRTDAAVVFQRKDSYTGDVTYIYHGNDGTHMPWNDTAQLNLLNPEVRESLIQTIMHVARKTPIIRFDAAMTLAKKHYQRLWFPQPGTGGAVPSRSDYAMSRSAFDDAMPVEFWREVVDRINAEMPQTLLLAEAFWLMESYFVRTLGMHRVYNSAFMHMMMKEENQKYHELLKNTLEFNPEILKRYVNFMSNPDEETAVNQFGKGDKYFGICVMLITMPGLPMFAHGQIEGFSEKYGMEYKQAYYNEFTDDNLVKRHESEIFPLSQKRYLFSQVSNFELYDFINNEGNINENVFAFSNKHGEEKAIILFNNSYEECSGIINHSSGKAAANGNLYVNKLADAAGIKNDSMFFYICKEHKTGLEYIFNGKDLHTSGLFTHLSGYEYKIFWEFREVFDNSGIYRTAYDKLSGSGIPSFDRYFYEIQLEPVHSSLGDLLSPGTFRLFESYCLSEEASPGNQAIKDNILSKAGNFLDEFNKINTNVDKELYLSLVEKDLSSIKMLYTVFNEGFSKKKQPVWLKESLALFSNLQNTKNRKLLFPAVILRNLSAGRVALEKETSINIFDELLIDNLLYDILKSESGNENNIDSYISLIKTLCSNNIVNSTNTLKNSFPDESPARKREKKISSQKPAAVDFIENLFKSDESGNFLGVNEYNGKQYYHKESFENLISWVYILQMLNETKKLHINNTIDNESADLINESVIKKLSAAIRKEASFYNEILSLSEKSGYVVKDLTELASEAVNEPVKKPITKARVNADKKKDTVKIVSPKKTNTKGKKTVVKRKDK
jgi:glycosidase